MEYKVDRFSAACAGVTISYTAEDVSDAFERAAKAIGKGMNLPGYRLGKIPTKVIKSRFASRVAADATELLADAGLIGILKKEGIRRISATQYKGEPAVDGKPFEVKTSFDVLPDIDLPNLRELSVVVGDPQPSEDALNAMLDQALGRLSQFVDVTGRKPEDNDLLTVDVRGSVDGMALPGMTADGFRMKLLPAAPGAKVPEMDPIVRALSIGEEGDGTMVCPDNYPDPTMRGKTVALHVALRRIQKEVLPPLTDETAQKLGFATFDALKSEVWKQTFTARMRQIQRDAKAALMEEQLAKLDFVLPEGMVQHFYREHQRDAERYLKKQHADEDTIVRTLQNMQDESMEFARKKAKGHTFLLALAEREGIRVTAEEAEAAVRALAKDSGQAYDELRKTVWENGVITAMQERMLVEKALERLYGEARKVMADKVQLRPFSEVAGK